MRILVRLVFCIYKRLINCSGAIFFFFSVVQILFECMEQCEVNDRPSAFVFGIIQQSPTD